MKSTFILAALALPFFTTASNTPKELPKKESITFTENKGQIHDQNNKPRPDILFGGSTNGMVYHLKQDGISYQLTKVKSWKETEDKKTNRKINVADKTEIYRVDVNWLNVNSNVRIEKGNPEDGYSNFYLENCPDGALNVKSYKSLTYKNIYDRIDLKWYEKNGALEYDFIVAPNSDYNQIKIQIKGAEKLSINKKGELEIKTPFGIITEQSPIAYQGNKSVAAKWSMGTDDEVVGIRLGNYDPALPITIDPVVRVWGTYYGGTANDIGNSCVTDIAGNVYLSGLTVSNSGTIIATVGSHQATYGGGTFNDAFLVKFNSAGVRQWGTYYGGAFNDYSEGCAVDVAGNVFLAGSAASYTGTTISTVGCHQPASAGNSDAFLVKFNSAGVRQWGTYYGGPSNDYGRSCATDASGNIYLAGTTGSLGSNIATAGSHQTMLGGGFGDAFLVKFNSAGVRQWGTYYGGPGNDYNYSCATDATNNVYISGESSTNTGTIIATAVSHQPLNGGGVDAFLVKFNSLGVRQWGTYYGGTGGDLGYDCATDPGSNVYLVGHTTTIPGTAIATALSHQTAIGGGDDAFLVKFNSAGVRQWGTYYGGTGNDIGNSCTTDASSNVYLAGEAGSNTGTIIATSSSHQTVFGGGTTDAFLVKFNTSGVRQWGTYYGGTGNDIGQACTTDPGANIYLVGQTTTTSGIEIATAGSHQSAFGGGTDEAYIVKFADCSATFSTTSTPSICSGQNGTLTASGSGITSYSWSTGSTTSSITPSPTITTSYTVTANTGTAGCSFSSALTITVNPVPNVTLTASTPSICSGSSVGLTATGATTYSWSTSATTSSISVSPTTTTNYTVIGTTGGCTNTKTITVNVTTTPTVNVSASSNSICTGSSSTITATGATTYSWNTSATTSVIAVSPTVTTTYTVTGNNGSCSNTRTITIVNNTPNLNVSATSTAICAGGTATITASGATTYSWNTGATTPAINVSPSGNTSYTVTGTTGACTSTSVITINVSTAITMNIATSNSVSCSGAPVVLTANGASTYTWNTGSNSTTISVTPSVSTTYTVNGTSGTCNGSTVVTIGISTNPTVNSITSSSLICTLPTQQSATITASGATTYSWNTGATTAAITVSPGITTTYTVTGYNAQGCFNTSVITQSVATCTGVNELSSVNEIIIFPNPSNGEFIIKGVKGTIEIYNSIGQTVYTSEINNDELKVSGLATGIYYLRIVNAKGSTKIIVNN